MSWIRISERMPPPREGVLVTDGKIVTAAVVSEEKFGIWLSGHGFGGYEYEFDFRPEDVTHWMPLPDLPK